MTSEKFIGELRNLRNGNSQFAKRHIFELARKYKAMPTAEVVKLLRSDDYDQRLGAVSVLDWKARDRKITEQEREKIFKAYLTNHQWIDDWGLVDRAAPYVVGGYLFGKDRKPLYDLARSKFPMERRTAIVSTYYFIRQNDIKDTFKIAEILVRDENDYVQMAVGSWIREAGKKDITYLTRFLDKYASIMNRKCLRYAIEKMDATTKKKYLNECQPLK